MLQSAHTPDNGSLDGTQLRRAISIFQGSSRARSIWQLVNTLVPYALVWYLAYRALAYSFWLALPLIVIAAGFMIRIFIVFHDCGHGAFFRSKRANDFWGVVTGILTFTPYHHWRASHARHHATSGNLDKRGTGDIWMMTLDEYLRAPRRQRLQYRLYRNPLVMFLLGPLLLALVNHRIPRPSLKRIERISIHTTNLAILAVAAVMIWLVGWQAYLTIQLLAMFLAHVAGVWLFYVQHQFEGVHWDRDDHWDFVAASLEGGSFYKLPAIMRWFTGSIGYHHVHHLNPRIPNYNLKRCHNQVETLQRIKPVKLFSSLKALRFRLWDEANGRLIGFREATRLRRTEPA